MPLNDAFVVNRVDTDHPLEEYIELLMLSRVLGNLKKRFEDVAYQVGVAIQLASFLVDIEQSRYLNQPPDVRGE
jgi:hypothetical protein